MPRFATLGLLEAVWQFCGRFTPQGNIGKYSDEEIESWVEWSGDSGALINALVECRWLDRDDEHRLVVHDWQQHADDATKLAVKRSGSTFVVPTLSGHCRDTVTYSATVSGLPEPEPEPEPVPVPEPGGVGGKAPPSASNPSQTKTKRFQPPTIPQLQEYFTEIGLAESPERFLAYYESKGWLVGKSPMRDWRAAARTWLSNRKPSDPPRPRPVVSAIDLAAAVQR